MKRKLETVIVLIIAMLGVTVANAQMTNKNEFRAFYGTGSPDDASEMFAKTLGQGLFGKSKSEFTSFGTVGLGYHHHFDKFSVGLDFGYSSSKEEYFKDKSDKKPAETYKMNSFLILPTASYSYFKKGIFDLYGSASAGMQFATRKQDIKGAKLEKETDFAYQINPIGVRIGNENIGGFVELGYGNKGIVSAGISFKF